MSDDVAIGGSCEDILHDIEVMEDAKVLGLVLNASKSEIISRNMSSCGTLLCALPGAQLVDPSRATLLGSHLGDDSWCFDCCL